MGLTMTRKEHRGRLSEEMDIQRRISAAFRRSRRRGSRQMASPTLELVDKYSVDASITHFARQDAQT